MKDGWVFFIGNREGDLQERTVKRLKKEKRVLRGGASHLGCEIRQKR